MESLWIVAQTETGYEPTHPQKITSDEAGTQTESITIAPAPNGEAPQAPPPKQQRGQGGMFQLFLLGAMFILIYLVLFRGPRKKQQQQKQMIQSLKKNDKVRTIGGIIGTIIDIKDDEIILKVDEANNTKIRIVPGSVSRNVSQE